MLVLLEGMDNTGKTTLATRLHESLNIPVVKPAPYKNVADKETYTSQLIKFLELATENADFIVDRHPIISENVYGPIIDNRCILTQNPLWTELAKALARANPAIVYCRPPEQIIREFGARGQMTGVIEKAPALIFRYDSLMRYLESIGFNIYRYDWTTMDYNDVLDWCNKRQKGHASNSGEKLRDMAARLMLYCYFPAIIDVTQDEKPENLYVDVLIDSLCLHASGVLF